MNMLRVGGALLSLIVAGCGSAATHASPVPSNASPPAPAATSAAPASAGTVTLFDDACIFEPAATRPAGAFTIRAINTTSDEAGFDLYRLRPAETYAAWVAGNEVGQAAFDAGVELHGPSDIGEGVDLQEAVGPNGQGKLSARGGEPAVYALQCWQFPTAGRLRLMAAGPVPIGRDAPETPQLLTTTLTAEGCAMRPAKPSITSGPAEISLINASPDAGWFGLHRISDGHSYAEFDALITSERRRVQDGEQPAGPPPWVTIPEIVEPAAWHAASIQPTLAPGIHAVVCGQVDVAADRVIGGPYLVGPFGSP